MKQYIFYTAALLLFITACKKNDQTTSYWTLNGVRFTPLNIARTPSATPYLQATNGNNNFSCHFASFPTSSGTYKIVSTDSLPGAAEMTVMALYNGKAYGSVAGNVNATVEVNSGRISITVPETVIVSFSHDSLKATAYMAEY